MTPAKREPDTTTYAGRFAARLAELRQAAGLSQVELAKRLGVTQGAVSKWELGDRFPPPGLLPILAQSLDLAKTIELYPDE